MFQYFFFSFWESCFCSFAIISSQANYYIGRASTLSIWGSWGGLLICPNNYWKRERERGSARAQSLHKLSQYDSWNGEWGSAGDALRTLWKEELPLSQR